MQSVRVTAKGVTSSGMARNPRTSLRATVRVRPARTTLVPQASLQDAADFLAKGFLKIFTPPTDGGVNWKGTSTGYPGDINRRSRYPTSVAENRKSTDEARTVDEAAAIEMESSQPSTAPAFMEYVSGALQRVMGHNFKGDETEPDWDGTSTGWSGEIRDRRNTDGFHSKKM